MKRQLLLNQQKQLAMFIHLFLEKLLETNQSIVDDPSNVNKDPENNGWFFKIKIKNKSELDELMNKEDYEKFVKENPN